MKNNRIRRDEGGASLAEYAMILALVAVACITAIQNTGETVRSKFNVDLAGAAFGSGTDGGDEGTSGGGSQGNGNGPQGNGQGNGNGQPGGGGGIGDGVGGGQQNNPKDQGGGKDKDKK